MICICGCLEAPWKRHINSGKQETDTRTGQMGFKPSRPTSNQWVLMWHWEAVRMSLIDRYMCMCVFVWVLGRNIVDIFNMDVKDNTYYMAQRAALVDQLFQREYFNQLTSQQSVHFVLFVGQSITITTNYHIKEWSMFSVITEMVVALIGHKRALFDCARAKWCFS